jgi:hypothetical protein
MLCQLCQSMFDGWEDCTIRVMGAEPFGKAWRKRGRHHSTVESLKTSTSFNCYICHILLKEWKRHGEQPGPDQIFYYVNYSLDRDMKKYGGFVDLRQQSLGALAVFGLEELSESGTVDS